MGLLIVYLDCGLFIKYEVLIENMIPGHALVMGRSSFRSEVSVL